MKWKTGTPPINTRILGKHYQLFEDDIYKIFYTNSLNSISHPDKWIEIEELEKILKEKNNESNK